MFLRIPDDSNYSGFYIKKESLYRRTNVRIHPQLQWSPFHFKGERIRLSEYKHNLMLIYSKYTMILIVLKNSAFVNTVFNIKKNCDRIVANYYLRKINYVNILMWYV